MKKEDLNKVKLRNASDIELICRYKMPENNKKTAMLYCSGFGGSYGQLGNVFSDYACDHGMIFVWGQFQDTYDIKETKKYKSDGTYDKINIGATYSCLESTKEDFDCFFEYIESLGIENLHVVATCVSCSKVVKYLLDGGDKNRIVKSLALLAPQDLSLVKNRSKHIGLTEEAKIYMSAGKPKQLLSKPFLGYMSISAESYLDICFNEEYNTLPYLSDENRLKELKKIEMPMLFVLAEKDGAVLKNGTLSPNECVELLRSHCGNAMSATIPNSSHLFDGFEHDVVDKLDNFYTTQKAICKQLGD